MKRNLNDLRDHLFDTLESLKAKENPMDLDRAKAIASVAQTIINSATVEVKAMNAMGSASESGFFGPAEKALSAGNPNGRILDGRILELPPDPKAPLQSRKLRTEPPGR